MPIEVLMPALSPTMKEGNLARWLKKEGDNISAGDVVAEIETDKATMEVEAVDEGILGKILIKEGSQSVAVNSLIALILEEGEDKKSLDSYEVAVNDNSLDDKVKDSSESDVGQSDSSKASASQTQIKKNDNTNKILPPIKFEKTIVNINSKTDITASPVAKRIAQEQNINLSSVSGSGPKGRIVKEDIVNLLKSGAAGGVIRRNPTEYELVANSNVRKVIAERLLSSKQNVPHFYLNSEVRMDKLMSLRKDLNENSAIIDGKPAYKISVNDLIIKAVSLALKKVPAANSSWDEDAVILYNNIDISVAVAVDDGLITPIIRNADQKSVIEISSEMKSLILKAKSGKLQPEEFQGGGFTISNLGMYGINSFSAIVNPPQSCILSVGGATKKPVIGNNDQIEIGHIMNAGLSSDHRSVDGSVGAQFLSTFKKIIESPVTLLL
ncbi:pyruvate dehydrogenase complex dihydrolipoamide acetyltransferase [Rickettsiales bacterium]|nr:pyruvate dehydrogenase complex dihydrolipoamide acetyltransferase [Rickettsiales bacterium]